MNRTLPQVAAGEQGACCVACRISRANMPGMIYPVQNAGSPAPPTPSARRGQRDPGQFIPCTVQRREGFVWPRAVRRPGLPRPSLLLSWTGNPRPLGSSAFCLPPPRNGAGEKCIANQEKAGEKTPDRMKQPGCRVIEIALLRH